ncbi:uncharacterized protein LOC129596367 isoform X2 [Paramacrobiotus metropolitanus]|nr:uncharacterized protein LOC129596367 isoform X2 [Paramacrobiotus metropolitanus]
MFVFVQVEVNGTEWKELVPIWQVRLRPSTKDLQERVIVQGHISSRSCRLPKGYREGPVEHDVWEEWKREMETDGSKAYPVCVLGNVQRRFMCNAATRLPSSPLIWKSFRETLAKHLKTVSAAPAVISDGSVDMQFSALSLNIIIDIFRMLSTVDRTKCRRVCGQWDAILTSGGTMGDIRVSFATSSIWPETQYIFLVSILKSLDPATKWIIIKNCEHNRTFNNLLIECVSWIAKVSMDTNAKKLQIIIHKCFLDDWDADDVRVFIFDYLRSFAQQLFDVAKRLRGTVLVWSSCTYRAPLTLPNVHTPMGKGSMSLSSQTVDSMEATLYSLFEKDLPVLVPLDELSTWISEVAIGGPEAVEKSGILPILNYYGSLDCRMKKLGKFVKSTAGNLKGLDVTKLPKLAVYVLGLKMMSCQANVAV